MTKIQVGLNPELSILGAMTRPVRSTETTRSRLQAPVTVGSMMDNRLREVYTVNFQIEIAWEKRFGEGQSSTSRGLPKSLLAM